VIRGFSISLIVSRVSYISEIVFVRTTMIAGSAVGCRLASVQLYLFSAADASRESVDIANINDKPIRAQEILDAEGSSTITSLGISVKRDNDQSRLLPSKGTTTTLGWESVGALGGDYTFQKFSIGFDGYRLLHEDLLDRKTILELHADTGYISGSSHSLNATTAAASGRFADSNSVASVRVRARMMMSVGGDFIITGSAQVSFPVVGDSLRGVVFTDAGNRQPGL